MLATKQYIFSCVAPGILPGSEALAPRTTKRKIFCRVVGPNERRSIVVSVSTRCIRMNNWRAVDLYNHLPMGTGIVAP